MASAATSEDRRCDTMITVRPSAIRARFAWTIASLLETADGAATIPFSIDAAAHGNYLPFAHAYAAGVGANLDARARLASFWVILCSEPWAAQDPAVIARAGSGSYLVGAAVARAHVFWRACRDVPRGWVSPREGAVAVTRTPVLLLAGGDDPLDPVANLRGWRRAFPNGRLVVVPGAGHGQIGYECIQMLVARFISGGRGNGSCVHRVPLPSFVTG